ncbi:ESCRT-0 subunit protein hse1, partial [Ceratobasidium sp. 370]
MFRGGQVNPYDDIIVKATDENQTSENWEILINLCDKVSEDGEQGARNVIAALLKRLTHRNANVQLYALSVAEALSKNCDITVHREMASKAFTQGLEKLATDRNGHEKVKKRTLGLIKLWAGEFARDPQLGLMEECYSGLKAKGMRFEDFSDNPAPQYDDEAARREEEELQRVLEMSKIVKRVRALHDFSATEVGELSFKKGDVIKVVDRCFKDWWRGQIKGRTGIFPVNYVVSLIPVVISGNDGNGFACSQEPLPEPTAAELAKDAEAEALVFSQGGAIDTLLQKLREFDPAAENLNDNEEIQELYRSSMSLRPKILKLIDKYSQKKAELVVMNERYVKARNTFERMMEESVAKHNPSAAVYDYQPPAGPDQYGQPGNRATVYGWNQGLYGQGAGVLQPIPDAAAYAYQQQQAQQAQQQQQPPAPVPNVPQEYPPQPYGQSGYPQAQDQYVQQYGYAGYQPQPQPGQEQAQGQGQYPQPYPGAQQQPGQPQQ